MSATRAAAGTRATPDASRRAEARARATAVCPVCPRHCRLAPGELGACRARRGADGAVAPEAYGRVTALALDPVEKKPLARFLPGAQVLSVGSYGCNLSCPFCQNHEIAQVGADGVGWRILQPDELVAAACALRERDPRVAGIAYTYNEPLVSWEYVRDCALLAHEAGLANVLVSNGLAEKRVAEELAPLIDAANIDLKGFSPAFYEMCWTGRAPGDAAGSAAHGARALACVKRTIALLARCPTCHVEVTTLVVPGLNDADEEIGAAARWLAGLAYREEAPARWHELAAAYLGGSVPENSQVTYHVTRFFPRWRLTDRAPTPAADVHRLADVARAHLAHVHAGNC